MAYLLPITFRCDASGCLKPVKYEVRSNRNEDLGRFCTVHARQCMKRRRDYEEGERRRFPEFRAGQEPS